MNRTVQILLLAAVLLPMFGTVHAETLAERKKRITRKYQRERSKITQSELVVPSDQPEDERIAESEKFKEPEVDLSRKRSTLPAPMPRPMPVPPPKQEDHWLQGAEDEQSDPYADPFAFDQPKDSETDLWGNRRQDGGSRYSPYRTGSPYDRSSSDPYASSSRYGDGQGRDSSSIYGQSSLYDERGSTAGQARTDLYGRPINGSRTPGTSIYSPRTYGSSPDTGMLTTPFQQLETPENTNPYYRRPGTAREESGSGYTPYRSPYQVREEQRQQQRNQFWNGRNNQQQAEEYRRPDNLQQWRERNRVQDPTRDDAYLDELMQRNRR